MYDHVSDLHLDNAMTGGPLGWLGRVALGRYKTPAARRLIIAGDTTEHLADTVDVLNGVAPLYDRVVAVLGNHETAGQHPPLRGNVAILDLLDHPLVEHGVAYVGGCLGDEAAVMRAAEQYRLVAPGVDRVVVVSHYVPSPRISALVGRDISGKANHLLEQIGAPIVRTDVVFGHVHLAIDGEVAGFKVRSNPRGYRGKLRDGSDWPYRFASFD